MNTKQIQSIYPMGLTSVAMPHDDFSRLPLFTKHNIRLIEVTPLVPDNKEWIPGNPESTKQFLSKCEANNVTPSSVHCYFFSYLGHDVTDKDPNIRKKAIEMNKVLFQGAKDAILAYLPAAEQTGVKIAIENLDKAWSVKHINELIDDIDHLLLGICFDTGHAAVYDDVGKELRLCGDRLVGLHIHDNHFTEDEHFAPFRGKIDWKAFASALVDIGYKGPLMLESYVRNKGESSDSFFRECQRAYGKLIEFIAEELKVQEK